MIREADRDCVGRGRFQFHRLKLAGASVAGEEQGENCVFQLNGITRDFILSKNL